MNLLLTVAGAVAILATLMVITRPNAVHAVLYLIVSLLAVALVFALLGAPFAAALEVIIYAGAIMVLFIFVVMMLNTPRALEEEREWMHPAGWLGPALLAALLLAELAIILLSGGQGVENRGSVGPREVGMSLLGTYLLGVELASLLLLAGLVGALHLTRLHRTGGGEKGMDHE